jgi:acetylornithine/N-succinyldiaminopimelate aminotransferase
MNLAQEPSRRRVQYSSTAAGGEEVLAPVYRRPPVLFVGGQGSWLEDEHGARYLDMTSGIAVNALGHAPPEIVDTLRENANGLIHVSNLYHTAPAIDLARALIERSCAHQVFFANSGSEANEAAIKFARLAGGQARRDIVYFEGSFHGRTFASLSATDRPDYREPFEPLPGGFRRAPWNRSGDDLGLDVIGEQTAAVLLEPIQGEAGVRVPNESWLQAVRDRCDKVGAMLIFDEVQCGLGRTGSLFGYESFGVVPDIVTLAKPLAGGLPMGAVLLGERAAAAVRPGCHGTTFGGGPLVAKVALKVLETVSRPLFLASVTAKGERLRNGLKEALKLDEEKVRGRGLMIGIEVPDTAAYHSLAFEEHLLVVPAGQSTIRFLPPLNVTDAEIDSAVERFANVHVRYTQEANS